MYPQEDGNSSSKASPKSLEQFQTTRRRFRRSTSKRTPHPTTECMSPGASRHGQNVRISFGNFNSLHSGEEVAFSLVNVGSLKGEREEERDEGGRTSSSVSQAWLSISLRRCLNTPDSSSQSRITHGEAALRGRNGCLPYHRLFLDPVWGSRDAHTHECDHDGSRYSRAAFCWPRTDHSFPRFACCRTEALVRTCNSGSTPLLSRLSR